MNAAYAAPLLLARCALCSAREGLDVYVMPSHRHAEPASAATWPIGVTVTWAPPPDPAAVAIGGPVCGVCPTVGPCRWCQNSRPTGSAERE